MSTAVAGIGTAVLAVSIAFTVQAETQEARRQPPVSVPPSEVQLLEGTQTPPTEEERARQLLKEHLRSLRVDADVPAPPAAEVTCAIRMVRPDLNIDPGIYLPAPLTNVESKIRVFGDPMCQLPGGPTASFRTSLPIEKMPASKRTVELPHPSSKR